MTDSQINLGEAEQGQLLTCAAPFVFLLVAAADGNVDRKELKSFANILAHDDYQILAASMAASGVPLDQMVDVAKSYLQNPIVGLVSLTQVIDASMDKTMAGAFKVALFGLARAVAEASGGFLGFLGNKIDKNESAVLDAIAGMFGVDRETGLLKTAAAEVSAPQSGELLTDELFPALKTAEWAVSARKHVAMQSLYACDDIQSDEPVVGYVHDHPETVAFINSDSLGKGTTITELHEHAMANLERRLAGNVAWDNLSFDANVEGLGKVEGLVLGGDYFASEAILSEKILKQAHAKLDSAMLMAVVPQRGEIFVTNLISQENAEPERIIFVQFALKRFFNNEQSPVSTKVFIIRNGKIVGTVGGMDTIVEQAQQQAAAEQQQDEEALQHSGSLKGTQHGTSLHIDVNAACVATLEKNLQFVIKNYVSQVVEDASFDGEVHVKVAVSDPGFDESNDREQLDSTLSDMFAFLNNQFVATQVKAQSGAAIALQLDAESHIAA